MRKLRGTATLEKTSLRLSSRVQQTVTHFMIYVVPGHYISINSTMYTAEKLVTGNQWKGRGRCTSAHDGNLGCRRLRKEGWAPLTIETETLFRKRYGLENMGIWSRENVIKAWARGTTRSTRKIEQNRIAEMRGFSSENTLQWNASLIIYIENMIKVKHRRA